MTPAQAGELVTDKAIAAAVDGLAFAIGEADKRDLESKIRNWPRTNHYASQIPECDRQGYYNVVHWADRKLHDAHLQARFGKGNDEETALLARLSRIGFQVVETQVPFPQEMMDRYRISGKIDGKMILDVDKILESKDLPEPIKQVLEALSPEVRRKLSRHRIPVEIKSCHPNRYAKFNSIEDMRSDYFANFWYRQLTVYLLGHNEEFGIFFLTDCLGHFKMIILRLDYDEAEKILSTVERINGAIDKKELPERIPFDPEICGKCNFSAICLQDIINDPKVVFLDNPTMVKKIDRYLEIDPIAKEAKKLREEIREVTEGKPEVVIGDFIISGKMITKKKYDVPDDIKAKYEGTREEWRMKIGKP